MQVSNRRPFVSGKLHSIEYKQNAVSYAAIFSSDPTVKHWNFVKHVHKCVKSTLETGIVYKKCNSLSIESFDLASDTEQCKYITGSITLINSSPITAEDNSYTISLSTTKAAINALTSAVRNALYLDTIFSDLKINVELKFFGDNNAANSIVSININRNRSKYMAVKYAFISHLLSLIQIKFE